MLSGPLYSFLISITVNICKSLEGVSQFGPTDISERIHTVEVQLNFDNVI